MASKAIYWTQEYRRNAPKQTIFMDRYQGEQNNAFKFMTFVSTSIYKVTYDWNIRLSEEDWNHRCATNRFHFLHYHAFHGQFWNSYHKFIIYYRSTSFPPHLTATLSVTLWWSIDGFYGGAKLSIAIGRLWTMRMLKKIGKPTIEHP